MPAIIALKIGRKGYSVPRYTSGSNEILGDVGHTEEIGSRQTLHAGYEAGRTGSNLNGKTQTRMVEGPHMEKL
jgi:hypothetical protein